MSVRGWLALHTVPGTEIVSSLKHLVLKQAVPSCIRVSVLGTSTADVTNTFPLLLFSVSFGHISLQLHALCVFSLFGCISVLHCSGCSSAFPATYKLM